MSNTDDYLYSTETDYIELSAISVLGNRTEQQDSFGYLTDKNKGVFVLCDGMGGYEGGRNISILAVEKMLEKYSNMNEDDYAVSLNNATKQINYEILEIKKMNNNLSKAGSTIISIVIDGKHLYWSAMGDSRVYIMRNNEFVQVTQDQNYMTVLNEKLRQNLISHDEYQKESSRGDILISYLGASESCLIDYNNVPFELKSDDVIVMMSDGLYKLVGNDEMKGILNHFEKNSDALLAFNERAEVYATKNGIKRDNMTVAIIKIK